MTFELTNLGRQILLKAAAGEIEIVFTKMQIGDGAKQDPLTATALKNVKIDNISFTKFQSGVNFATLTAVVSNSELNLGFRITEAGVFVKDPNSTTNEILYAVGFEESQTADYVPSKSERLIDLQFDIAMYIGTAENISATLADALGYNPGVGKSLAGKMVTPVKTGVSVTAGEGAEIFNDYRAQTQSGLVKQGNLAIGEYSSAHGSGTTANGKCSSAGGFCTQANGEYSKANGLLTVADGFCSSSEGYFTVASGDCSHAEGAGTRTPGDCSHAEGKSVTALGYCSHAEGESYNNADSDYTYSTALDTIISDWQTNPFSLARGWAAHCEGTNTLALGDRSHSMGIYTVAKGVDSYAGGYYTLARAIQFVFGKHNAEHAGCENANGNVDTESQLASQSLFIIGNGTSEADSNAFRVTADGQCYGLKAFSAQGADFAEYFEWEDENPNNEDRRGKFVSLNGEKIKLANDGDYILGIVTGSGAFIGNSQSENWQGKYSKDVFGDWLTQTVEVPESTDEETGEIIPAHTVTQYVVNPDYDPDTDYIAREFRKEWSPVGMLGQVTLVDDGTCTVNGYCKPSINGVGTASESGFRVLKRLDESHVKVLVK